ncbi:MAG: glucose-6-phosphate isomerase, partial [Aestuariivirga sp.]
MRQVFAKDAKRFENFSASADDVLLDYSKCGVSTKTMQLLFAIAKAAKVESARDQMMRGDIINTTEHRAVLHTALRRPKSEMVFVNGHNVVHDVHDVLENMSRFATDIRKSNITDIVNIGIGGSDLGPAMATLALAPYHDGPKAHFVSNVDGADMADKLKGLNPATTLFIVASKTFTTIETLTNARTARAWIVAALGEAAVGDHFCALSTALDKVQAFGITPTRTFGFWDWVGGRYSIWSAIGLSLMIAIGPHQFMEFLHGAHAMDTHFTTAKPHENLPLIMGLMGIWHRNACNYATRAIIPYDHRMSRFPA